MFLQGGRLGVDVSITDSTQQQILPNPAYGGVYGPPPQCPSIANDTSVSLVPGDSRTFSVCFELPANNDPPRVVTVNGVDIPLTRAGAGVRAP
jgi:hypothetical protein